MKRILKALFPRVFLKQTFLVYNQIKAVTIDRLFLKRTIIASHFFLVNDRMNPFLESKIDINHLPESIKDKLGMWTDPTWYQEQYLLKYDKPGFIEPNVGWALTPERELIFPSLGFASAPYVHKPDLFETYISKPSIERFDAIISLRDTGEENYFHFFNDVLSKIFFLKENQVDMFNYKIVISESLFKKPYFQFFFENSFLKDFTWHIQKPGQWISFQSAIFCKPFTHTIRYFTRINELVKSSMKIDLIEPERKVFLTRSTSSMRFIENESELYPILEKFNFEIVDSSLLRFEEQVNLFRGCRFLVAIHGAGISNILFREGNELSLLEIIHPSPYIPFHYILMSKLFGYKYDVLLGRKGKKASRGGFLVEKTEFERSVKKLLEG